MVELRKRPAPAPTHLPKKSKATRTPAPKEKEAASAVSNGSSKPGVGDKVTLEGFGGEVETNDGVKTTLAKLVDESKAGVVLFTYPKASTPGCTTQACFFRDSYTELTSTGLSIFGLSNDSTKANTSFKTRQNLPYPLLCDPAQTLIKAIGMKKSPSGTTRGVFVVNKEGKVLAAEPGGPAPTMEVVRGIVQGMGSGKAEGKEADDKPAAVDVTALKGETAEHKAAAAVAAEVAESAAGVDKSGVQTPA